MASSNSDMQAVRFHPPKYDIRVERVAIPSIEHPDDAIVKIKLAGLCGSDLHTYRGVEVADRVHICGHEFVGEVVALGDSFGKNVEGRPRLYESLRLGDKVVAPFTVNCGECSVCRLGFTCRCRGSLLFGSPALQGAQAQFIRVPLAGGTLFNLSDDGLTDAQKSIADSSLMLLGDILPTGMFAAAQALNHPKLQADLSGKPWPACLDKALQSQEGHMTTMSFAVIGLGPVGVCAVVALLDMLASRRIPYVVVAIDPNPLRRQKMEAILAALGPDGKGNGKVFVKSIEDAKDLVQKELEVGCSAVLEIVGNVSALKLAYDLVRPFGVISSVGVHSAAPLPLTGDDMYTKNVSMDFGRCPARAMIPMAYDLLVKRQDVFGSVGKEASLVDSIVGLDEAVESYKKFDKGESGKILFDPWKSQ
ncbi:chaperonin 10-like protein [Schizophyllum amplum]|uniref:Chaperonin 10-like protein n=1 Tax=Schizophyllum amplum TaxID=97359 RepID=A0A550C3S4_9AGAR|nr:chaperonin 10-like protein [Auriculariopsis ampla]